MPLKAGVVQFSPTYGRVLDNLKRLEGLVEAGVRQGAELLVLPEMAWTGYLWRDEEAVRPYAEQAGHGPGQDQMATWARRWNIALVYGFPEVSGPKFHNSQGFATADGATHPLYRKTHLFEADTWWATPGDSGYLQWDSPWGSVGSGICMDLNFDDLVAYHSSAGTKILTFSTNWLDQDFDILPYWEERLTGLDGVGFQGISLFANRGGEEFGVRFRGQSALFEGNQRIAALPGTEEGVLVRDWEIEGPVGL